MASTPSPSQTPNHSQTPNETEDLEVARGDVAAVPLSVPASSNVTVTVGTGDEYTAHLAIADDGDGQVTLLVNTYLAGNRTTVAPGTYRTQGNDTVTVTGGTPTAPMDVGTYRMAVRENDVLVAQHRLTVTEPSIKGVTALRSIPRLFDATNVSEIRAANQSGLIQPLQPGEYGPEAVSGETVLLRIDAPSLLGAITAQPGNSTTEKFLALHDYTEPATNETFVISGPCGGIQFGDTVAEGGARVHLDYREGSVYVLLDTENLDGLDDGGQSAHVKVTPESRINEQDERRRVKTDFRISTRQTAVQSTDTYIDTVQLTASDRATIAGETNLLPGSQIPIRVESRVDSTFERQTTATVAENGTFTATVDLETASAPGLFAVEVGSEQYLGEIGDPPDIYWEVTHDADTRIVELSLDRLSLPTDGLLVAYRYDSATDQFRPIGSAISTADALLVDPITEKQQILLVAHRDTNGNRAFDGPDTDSLYRVGGRVVADWNGVSVEEDDPSTGDPPATFDIDRVSMPTTTQQTTSVSLQTTSVSLQTTSVSSTQMPDTSDSLDGDIPGFGPLVTLAVILGASMLLGRRRQ